MPAATLGATADMRPRLLEHVRFADSDDGVYLESDHGACTISGRHGYTWLSRLAPHLTGEHTLAELVEPLSADRRQLVEQLVAALAEQGFVVDARPEEPHTLSPGERATYQPEIAFIRYGADSAERRFERLREARVVLRGGGPVLAALLEAGLRSGWRQVLAIDTGAVPADLAAAVVRGRRDAAQDVRITTAGADDVLPPDVLTSEAGVLLHVHDGEHPDELMRMSRACAQRETALGQIWVRGAEAWLRPVAVGESESCWHRLTAMPYEEKPGGSGGWLTGAVPAVLATQLALSCFEHLTGTARPPGQPVLTRVDLRTLETQRHRAHAHPRVAETHDRAGRCEETDVRAAFDRLAGLSPVESGDLLAGVAAYVDRRTGVLGSLGAEGLVQVPMGVCRAVVSDPYGVLPAWSTAPAVLGWGRTGEQARSRAVLAALAAYQWLAENRGEPRQGVEPVTGRVRAVPMAETPATGQAPVGVAAGLSWSQAVAAGLAQHCDVMLRRVDPVSFPVAEPVSDVGVADLLRLLEAAGERVEIRDLSTMLGLPGYAVLAGGQSRVACAMTPAGAMRRALERLLLAWQSRAERQSSYADPPARWPDEDLDATALADALAKTGRAPVVVPLGRDEQVGRLLPFTAWVVCRDD
ncbi:hypothetical protein OHA77_39895 [Streptosporangium sp. NBC_01639]|uniref:hypothetical protein n=1 Tax=Streptosporangium sp. NBC_01639 TaxID=2975948 RepID=UPI003866E913|nr:hypothetical protein OHA77_39895 [Streptosporangium sp. NBC_01639]